MGVRTARALAVVEYCFFLSPFLPESLLHCLPAFQADPLFSDRSSDLHFSLSCQCHPVEQKRAAYTGNTHDQNSGRPLLKISVVEISAAPAEMAGAPGSLHHS